MRMGEREVMGQLAQNSNFTPAVARQVRYALKMGRKSFAVDSFTRSYACMSCLIGIGFCTFLDAFSGMNYVSVHSIPYITSKSLFTSPHQATSPLSSFSIFGLSIHIVVHLSFTFI